MADFVNVGKVSEIGQNEMKLVSAGNEELVLTNISGDKLAFGNACPHASCPLAEEGQLNGEELVCTCHGSRFNIRTGEVLSGPAQDPLTLYSVRIQGSDVLIGPQLAP